jgi:hypothetical protein
MGKNYEEELQNRGQVFGWPKKTPKTKISDVFYSEVFFAEPLLEKSQQIIVRLLNYSSGNFGGPSIERIEGSGIIPGIRQKDVWVLTFQGITIPNFSPRVQIGGRMDILINPKNREVLGKTHYGQSEK